MKKWMIFLLLIVLSFTNVYATNQPETDLTPSAKSAILVEPKSGKIIYEKNADERLYPASMTKMMSMILVLEAIHSGKLNWDTMVTVSDEASKMGGSQIYLEVNEQMSVRDLFKSVCIASANDAIYALAEAVSGTEPNFVSKMNAKAKELGLENTNFVNTTGLHDPNHYSSARDMAKIASYLLSVNDNEVLQYSSTFEDYVRQDTDKPFWLVNTNKLIKTYPGLDGLKTGFTQEAMYCITLTAKREGLRFISVVMKEPTREVRNAEASKLLDYGFSLYDQTILYEKGAVVKEIKIENGLPNKVNLVTMNEIPLIYEKGNQDSEHEEKIEMYNDYAPLKPGDIVAKITITSIDGMVIEDYLTVDKEINKLQFLDMVWLAFNRILG